MIPTAEISAISILTVTLVPVASFLIMYYARGGGELWVILRIEALLNINICNLRTASICLRLLVQHAESKVQKVVIISVSWQA